MVQGWAEDEMEGLDLKNTRLNKRAVEILSQLGEQPMASIPAACGGYAEMAAAYRLFDNQKVYFENVLEPHIEATCRRMAEQAVVMLVQDTTEIDLTRPQQQVIGAGPLDGSPRRGMFLHLLHAFTPDGTPLGTVDATVWTRSDELTAIATASEREAKRKLTPIEEKESQRWIDTLRQARAVALQTPDGPPETCFVCVADSESDIDELWVEAEAQPLGLKWIVRSCQDRALEKSTAKDSDSDELSDSTAGCIRAQVLASPVRFTDRIDIRARQAKISCEDRGRRQSRQPRQADVQVRAQRVKLRPPWRPDRTLPPIWVNVVLIREINVPEHETPVEWMLLTNLPIDEVAQIRQVIQYDQARWHVELFFRTLKSGCRIQARRFEHIDRIKPCLALYLIVTWRTLYVCRLGRSMPDISCEAVFAPCEWKSVYRVVRREAPPSQPPRLVQMVLLVAQLGGYVNRKPNAHPGPQTVWLGLQRMHDIALCGDLFGPEAALDPPRPAPKTEDRLV